MPTADRTWSTSTPNAAAWADSPPGIRPIRSRRGGQGGCEDVLEDCLAGGFAGLRPWRPSCSEQCCRIAVRRGKGTGAEGLHLLPYFGARHDEKGWRERLETHGRKNGSAAP